MRSIPSKGIIPVRAAAQKGIGEKESEPVFLELQNWFVMVTGQRDSSSLTTILLDNELAFVKNKGNRYFRSNSQQGP